MSVYLNCFLLPKYKMFQLINFERMMIMSDNVFELKAIYESLSMLYAHLLYTYSFKT